MTNIETLLQRPALLGGGFSSDLFLVFNGMSYCDCRNIGDSPTACLNRLQERLADYIDDFRNNLCRYNYYGAKYFVHYNNGKSSPVTYESIRSFNYQCAVILAIAIRQIKEGRMKISYN